MEGIPFLFTQPLAYQLEPALSPLLLLSPLSSPCESTCPPVFFSILCCRAACLAVPPPDRPLARPTGCSPARPSARPDRLSTRLLACSAARPSVSPAVACSAVCPSVCSAVACSAVRPSVCSAARLLSRTPVRLLVCSPAQPSARPSARLPGCSAVHPPVPRPVTPLPGYPSVSLPGCSAAGCPSVPLPSCAPGRLSACPSVRLPLGPAPARSPIGPRSHPIDRPTLRAPESRPSRPFRVIHRAHNGTGRPSSIHRPA